MARWLGRCAVLASVLVGLAGAAAAQVPAAPPPSSPDGLKPGTRFRDCAACPWMIVVPKGSFSMGDVGGIGVFELNPVREVTLGAPIAVGATEVSFADWDACVTAGGCGHRPDNGGWGHGNRPVMNVSWSDARTYVAWLRQTTGKPYRLLSEAEWEYVARAGTRSRYSFGDSLAMLCTHANGADRSTDYAWANPNCSDGYARTAPVGSFVPNVFGLHDLYGNVSEWVDDCWHPSYDGAPTDGAPWIEGGECRLRVARGGSWGDQPTRLQAANRLRFGVDARLNHLGFRVARSL